MKYLAKYLPVGGEIKEGDKFTHSLTNQVYTNKDITPINHPDYKQVKLFLCSRDIQVGDRICDDNDDSEFTEVIKVDGDNLTVIYHGKEETVSRLHTMKVIGEISPDATWVIENQEFDESDIMIYEVKGLKETGEELMKSDNYLDQIKGKAMMSTIEPRFIKDNKGKTIVTVKCPTCKTFH